MPDNIIRESANCFLFARCCIEITYVERSIRIQNGRFVVETGSERDKCCFLKDVDVVEQLFV